ncbi:MAG: Flp pilus assembly protein CpaB [Xanthobacteraceae bacterium]
MRTSTLVMIAFAVVFGLVAVFLANSWLNNRAAEQMRNLEAQQNATNPAATIVVASRPLRFGDELSAMSLREIPWPPSARPPGSFSKISELTSAKHIVLNAIEVNEPVLAKKITNTPGQRATLSATLDDGMKAVSVRVESDSGDGGFVLPGDHVDVLLTHPNSSQKSQINDVVLLNVRVLGVDQLADERAEKPAVSRTVTLEVNEIGGQKLALASKVGSLWLLLRKPGDSGEDAGRQLTVLDLGHDVASAEYSHYSTIVITRPSRDGTAREEFSVPIEIGNAHAAAISKENLVHN